MTLRAKALEILRARILGGTLKSGDFLLEKEIAADLDMSKTPVREALVMLCDEGLVQLFPRRGYMVRTPSLEEILDTFDLRLILEGAAAERAAARIDADDLERLRDLARYDCRGGEHAHLHGADALTHSFDFHCLIARASGNRALAEQIERLLHSSRRIAAIGFTYGEHDTIVDALAARDPARARRAMEIHIDSGREAAVSALAGRGESRFPSN
ncbi:GntR family transcriptional regulator [Acuticoccus kandeliae]|uniref:GntR family transcriptional regulator n=1 Tax=Acuticoccus kandeliae TaxID=2073160 RepID=UPI000D3E8317|nr:GntR family transcriptional regulator [Acuticoccus kandeliae]